jgi:hypothetical protein
LGGEKMDLVNKTNQLAEIASYLDALEKGTDYAMMNPWNQMMDSWGHLSTGFTL